MADADEVKKKLKDMKYHRKHLHMVMNLNFNKPSATMLEKAKEAKIDLKD